MISNTGIWGLDLAKKRHKCDVELANTIFLNFKPNSFADIGCGNGAYCKIFKDKGWPIVHGYEGTKNITSLGIYNDIKEVDLTTKLKVERRYDLILCLEVGEHIPLIYEDVLIDNISNFVSNNLILSWAPPGQYSASKHVNLRKQDYIIQKFNKKGLIYQPKISMLLRKKSSFSWFRKNLMVFAYA